MRPEQHKFCCKVQILTGCFGHTSKNFADNLLFSGASSKLPKDPHAVWPIQRARRGLRCSTETTVNYGCSEGVLTLLAGLTLFSRQLSKRFLEDDVFSLAIMPARIDMKTVRMFCGIANDCAT